MGRHPAVWDQPSWKPLSWSQSSEDQPIQRLQGDASGSHVLAV